MGSRKGQIWVLDFTTGAIILTVILLLFTLIWNTLAIRWNSANDYRQLETAAIFASDSLMTTSGEPASWEMLPQIDGNITAFGLVSGRDELNNLKLDRLLSQNASAYLFVKQRLGLEKYELGINITDLNKNNAYYTFGKFAGPLNTSIVYDRMGLLNNSAVIVHIEVWK